MDFGHIVLNHEIEDLATRQSSDIIPDLVESLHNFQIPIPAFVPAQN